MSYRVTKDGLLATVEIVCEARKGTGICGSRMAVSMNKAEAAQKFIFNWGWRMLRGRQVCPRCLSKGSEKVHFPRLAKEVVRSEA